MCSSFSSPSDDKGEKKKVGESLRFVEIEPSDECSDGSHEWTSESSNLLKNTGKCGKIELITVITLIFFMGPDQPLTLVSFIIGRQQRRGRCEPCVQFARRLQHHQAAVFREL